MFSDIGIVILMSAIIVCGISFPALVIIPVVVKSMKEAREEKEYQEKKKKPKSKPKASAKCTRFLSKKNLGE